MMATKLLAFLLLATAGWAQLLTGSASTNGVSFRFETRLEPPAPGISKVGGGTLTEKNIAKRHVCDFEQRTYFGYDITASPLADGRYQFTISPLTITPGKMTEIFEAVKDWRLLPLPQQPATQILRAGETIALDLFVNPSTGQKITDYITVQGASGRVFSASGPARDFTIEDGSLNLSAPRLSINGNPSEATAGGRGGISGSPLWIYIAGHGRFVFSLLPRPDLGFQKAGEIRGSTMTWRWGRDEFSLNSEKRIAPGEGAYNLYVFNNPGYRPSRSDGPFVMGAGGKLESLVR
jgi:hypothetical protein